MIKMFGILAGGALLASTVVIAQTAAQSAADSPASASALGKDVDLTRGAKAWADHCGRCHNLRSPSELGENAWDVSVTHMRVGKSFIEPVEGERLSGVYRHPVDLVSGRYALIERLKEFTLLPWREAIEARRGMEISAVLRRGGIAWEVGRERGLGR